MEVLTRAWRRSAISDQRGKNFASLLPRAQIPAPGAKLIEKLPTAAAAAAIKLQIFTPHRSGSLRNKRKTPAPFGTGVVPTSIACEYYSSSGRSITLSVKYAPVGSSCEPLRTLSAEPSSVKVSLKSPFILTASSIESNSTTA